MNNKLIGMHCERFDITLLEQIVSLEVDCAVHRLMREQGIMIDAQTQAVWTQTICDRVQKATFEEINTHSFLPSVMNIRLRSAVEQLVREEVHIAKKHEWIQGPMPKKTPCCLRYLFSLYLFFKKQVE